MEIILAAVFAVGVVAFAIYKFVTKKAKATVEQPPFTGVPKFPGSPKEPRQPEQPK